MNKESIYLLQKIDCNCNDCAFMVRDLNKYNESLKLHQDWAFSHFTTIKNKIIKSAEYWKNIKKDLDKYNQILKDAESMKFNFDKSEVNIQYGNCTKFNKSISFIPNVCQLDTQKCFKHRIDLLSEEDKNKRLNI